MKSSPQFVVSLDTHNYIQMYINYSCQFEDGHYSPLGILKSFIWIFQLSPKYRSSDSYICLKAYIHLLNGNRMSVFWST